MFARVRAGLRPIVPAGLRSLWQRVRIEAVRRRNRVRGVADIFSEIYEANRWGGEKGPFRSGSGSTSEQADRYAGVIRGFIKEHDLRQVVDLGCGNFRIGARLVDGIDISYTGIDVVPRLIEDNRRHHGSEQVRFECLDITEDALPDGDLCLIRQVLQHLSNDQIGRILRRLDKYRFVIVTEHYPAPGALREKNSDKPCGEDVRIYDGSAVFLDAPPFNHRISGPLLDVPAGHCLMHPGERIRTYLIDNSQRSGVDGTLTR